MQQKVPLKKVICSICGEVIVLIAPKSLSPLHLASFHESSQTKEKKKLLKLSKKMLKIMTKFPSVKIELNENYNIVDRNIELFYEVYKRRELLTLKELMTLHDTCITLKKLNYFCIVYDKSEKDNYHLYSETINNLIELKKSNVIK